MTKQSSQRGEKEEKKNTQIDIDIVGKPTAQPGI
jgi:hypothetical protein